MPAARTTGERCYDMESVIDHTLTPCCHTCSRFKRDDYQLVQWLQHAIYYAASMEPSMRT